ncbi:hypothetical protein SANTM175S_06100 [Streptomyces antimycoticus]
MTFYVPRNKVRTERHTDHSLIRCPCCSIRHCAGIPGTAAGNTGAHGGAATEAPSGGGLLLSTGKEARRSLTTDRGDRGPPRLDTAPPVLPEERLVQRLRDASAGTYQEGWYGGSPGPPGPRGCFGGNPGPRGGTDRGSSPQHAQGSSGRTLGDQGPTRPVRRALPGSVRPVAAERRSSRPSRRAPAPAGPAIAWPCATGASAPDWSPCSRSRWSRRPPWGRCAWRARWTTSSSSTR